MKRTRGVWIRQSTGVLVAICFGAAILASSLRAEDDSGQARRAVRLSSVDGQVQLFQGNQPLDDQAVANTPLFEGTRVVTGNGGRAEIQFEDGSVARLSPDSSLTLTMLHPQSAGGDTEISLNRGLGYFEMQGESSPLRVCFGESVVTGSGFTVLRIDLDTPPGDVAVFSGNVHLEGRSVAVDLHGGESVALNGADPSQFNLTESIEPNSWDAWNSDRDQALTSQASSRTDATNGLANSKNPAWGDLDASGSWYNVPDQGNVWSPYEASNPGWDPYGTGNWVSTPGFGYVWASSEPWGYMPYQCGAWNYYNQFGWGWAPGICQPWWGGGGGWGYNIGYAPPRYRLPNRPRPRNPRPMGGARPVGPQPVISVNRRLSAGDTMLPARDKTRAVMIGGSVAEPLRPLSSRPRYDHVPVFSGNRPVTGNPASAVGVRPAYVRAPAPAPSVNGRSGEGWPSPRQGSSAPAPVYPSGSYPRPAAPNRSSSVGSAPAARPSGGGSGRAPASAPPAGGGGGGGGRPTSSGPHR